MRQRKRWNNYVNSRHNRKHRFSISSTNRYDQSLNGGMNRENIITVNFPADCRFIDNFESFNKLINDIIDKSRDVKLNPIERFEFDLTRVTKLDSSAINVMLTLANYLNLSGFNVRGSVPIDTEARDFMVNSGFFAMVRSSRKIHPTDDHFFTLSGNNQTNQDAIANEIRNIMQYLIGESVSYQPLYNTLGEIAGNSVEHANKDNLYKNWFMSVHYEESKAIIMMADIGKGILGTLNLLLRQRVYNLINWNKPQETLKKLFEGEYQSCTREPNRNNGLPEMMELVNKNYIKNVVVVTNDAVLDFKGNSSCRLNISFPGTFYLIEVTEENIRLWQNRQKQ